ncbi:MAG: putative membrane protein [Halioglobus sp.]|jgi:putative membrane protein
MKTFQKLFTLVIVLATLVVGVLFALQNKTPVPLDLLVYTFNPKSLALWILASLTLGGLLGLLASSAIVLRLRTSQASVNRKLAKATAELAKLRVPVRLESE